MRPNMRHRAKFRADRSNRCGDKGRFSIFFQLAAVSHLGFSIVENINFRSGSEAQYAL